MIYLIQAEDGSLTSKWSADPTNELAGLTYFTPYPMDLDGSPAELEWIAIKSGVPVVDAALKAGAIQAKEDDLAALKAKIADDEQTKKDLGAVDVSKLATVADIKPILDKILKLIGGL